MNVVTGLMDRMGGILYLLFIMRTKPGRTISLLLGCGIIAAGLVVADRSVAGQGLPRPETKPPLFVSAGAVPLPPVKPLKAAPAGASRLPDALSLLKFGTPPTPGRKPAPELAKKLPTGPLADDQAALYEKIFALQAEGKMTAASREITQLKNGLLMGHVLAQRYLHPTAYKASYDELARWMDRYSDHPQAKRIHALAQRKTPPGAAALKEPKFKAAVLNGNLDSSSGTGRLYNSTVSRSSVQQADVTRLTTSIKNSIKASNPGQAWATLRSDAAAKTLDMTEFDQLRAVIAAGYLYNGELVEARKLADGVLKRSGSYVPLAGWVKGLVHWQQQDYREAAVAFETAATSPYASGWMVSAASYWASRSNMYSRNVASVSHWLELAATYPHTFYGLMALRALGRDFDFEWDAPELTADRLNFIHSVEAGQRAEGLTKAGQISLAEAELGQINPGADPAKRLALLAFAHHNALPSMTLRLGNAVPGPEGKGYDAALYPLMPWEPDGGYTVDRALIYALIRQESRFNTAAESRSGAVGLMQLMPATARSVARQELKKDIADTHVLKNPRLNLSIGQAYVRNLLHHETVGQDLLSLAIAYNAGPGTLMRWKSERAGINDPLLFIETIPFAETRAFVERVLANYWIYQIRLNQPTPSLDSLAEGRWAHYTPTDDHIAPLRLAER